MNKIRLQDLTPDVYYKQSRDFQFIGRLYDAVLNSVKTDTELISVLPLSDNSDERFVDLMAMTLGFKLKHHYNARQLAALCSAFCIAMKNKGNMKAILTAIQVLLNAEGIKDSGGYLLEENNTVLKLYVPQSLSDVTLLNDLLDYILPAGMSCNIIREFSTAEHATTELTTTDEIVVYDKETWTLTNGTESTSILPQIGEMNPQSKIGNTPGAIMNSEINKVDE